MWDGVSFVIWFIVLVCSEFLVYSSKLRLSRSRRVREWVGHSSINASLQLWVNRYNKTLINYKRLVVVDLSLIVNNKTLTNYKRHYFIHTLWLWRTDECIFFIFLERKSIFKVNYLCFRFKPSMQIYTRHTKTPRINLERSVPFPKLTVKTIKRCHFQI